MPGRWPNNYLPPGPKIKRQHRGAIGFFYEFLAVRVAFDRNVLVEVKKVKIDTPLPAPFCGVFSALFCRDFNVNIVVRVSTYECTGLRIFYNAVVRA